MMLVAFDVLASDKTDLERLFRLLTQRFAFSDSGRSGTRNAKSAPPPLDSGILGGYIAPDNLTITLSVGHSLFDERFGLAPQMPKKLQKMTRFLTTRWMRRYVMVMCCYKFAPTPGTR